VFLDLDRWRQRLLAGRAVGLLGRLLWHAGQRGTRRGVPTARCPAANHAIGRRRLNAFYCPKRMTSTMRMFVGSTSTT
jgi:hypothetical protein